MRPDERWYPVTEAVPTVPSGRRVGAREDATDHLLSSPENARRLMEAVARDARHSSPFETSEAPTMHRPEMREGE